MVAFLANVVGCVNNAANLANDARVKSVAGSENDLVGSSVRVLEKQLSLISMPVVKIQQQDGSELWHFFPSETKVASCIKYVATRGDYSPSKEYGVFLRCFKQVNQCGYVFRLKNGRVESYSLIQNTEGRCPKI